MLAVAKLLIVLAAGIMLCSFIGGDMGLMAFFIVFLPIAAVWIIYFDNHWH